MLIGSLSLAGFPLFTGFFSKDEIIVIAYEYGVAINYLPYIFLVLAAILTAIYTFRIWFVAFTGRAKIGLPKHESPWIMIGPLVILAVFALGFGMPPREGSTATWTPTSIITVSNFHELAAIGGHAAEETKLAGKPATEPMSRRPEKEPKPKVRQNRQSPGTSRYCPSS